VLFEIAAIAAALEKWQHETDLQSLEREIRSESGSRDRDSYTQELNVTVERAKEAAGVAHRARDAADQLSTALGRVTAEFGERALKPFDELFKRYLRALVHDERFHNIEAAYEPAARSAGLRFKVELGGSDTEAEYILSEGQLGEVSLAAMLAANSAFPWSRWRALLLDDPTQYNDLIHATALFDVLRNLVHFAGHQMFVSTHDNEQAGFFRRKLDSMKIPWIECRFIAHSVDGIVTDIRGSSGEVQEAGTAFV
jgi:exonuclease SbcC